MTRQNDHMGQQDLADAGVATADVPFDYFVDNATKREVADALWRADARNIQALCALQGALPLLIKLGDFIGNGDGRCEAILAVRRALEFRG